MSDKGYDMTTCGSVLLMNLKQLVASFGANWGQQPANIQYKLQRNNQQFELQSGTSSTAIQIQLISFVEFGYIQLLSEAWIVCTKHSVKICSVSLDTCKEIFCTCTV